MNQQFSYESAHQIDNANQQHLTCIIHCFACRTWCRVLAYRTLRKLLHNITYIRFPAITKDNKPARWTIRNNTFGVSTGVTVFAILVYLLLANHALGSSIRSPPTSKTNEIEVNDLRARCDHMWYITQTICITNNSINGNGIVHMNHQLT